MSQLPTDPVNLLARISALEAHVNELYGRLNMAPPYAQTQPQPGGQPGQGATPGPAVTPEGYPLPSPSVIETARSGKAILAIKMYRQESGIGLKEAKMVVERYT